MNSAAFRVRPSYLALLLATIFGLQSYSASLLKSPTYDEPVHIAAGLSYVQTGIFQLNVQHPPLLKELAGISMLLGGIRWPAGAGEAASMLSGTGEPEWLFANRLIGVSGLDRPLFWARLPLILVSTLGGLLLYWFGRDLIGEAAALGALVVYAFDPTLLAHSFLVTTDVGLAVFTLLFLWTLWKYVERPDLWRLVLAGGAMGLMLCSKFSGIFLVPVAGILMLAAMRWPTESATRSEASLFNPYRASESGLGRRIGAWACSFALMCVVALVIIDLVYLSPRGVFLYIAGLRHVNADHVPGYLAYMGGHLQSKFRSYLAVSYLVKEPLAAIVLAVLGLYELTRTKGVTRLQRLFLFLPPAVLFIAYSVWSDNAGIRYLIPVLPFLYLAGGLGLAMLFRNRTLFARGLAVVLLLWIIVEAAAIYPDHLSYFNEAACLTRGMPAQIGFDGGTACGVLWLDDSNIDWGQGLKQLHSWLEQNASGRSFQFGYFGSFPPGIYGISHQPLDVDALMRGPAPGLYILSAHFVALWPAQEAILHPGDTAWLRRISPSAVIGHALYVYDIPSPSHHDAAPVSFPAP